MLSLIDNSRNAESGLDQINYGERNNDDFEMIILEMGQVDFGGQNGVNNDPEEIDLHHIY